ncbi:hypothetical protein I545_1885 [Mycobacterium kansasii 662]|uniref:Uncharacterized protein n=2 Tax=Mycobacterium kansasii TaxID=1768 RepID=A0A1V3XGF2_MYCKA|nr:hypothetical protein I545_1885 [Mycobacterium kansasii 662]OOK78293.1 hypothetical protein BZL30_2478 [Mycobacterium kansasii]
MRTSAGDVLDRLAPACEFFFSRYVQPSAYPPWTANDVNSPRHCRVVSTFIHWESRN